METGERYYEILGLTSEATPDEISHAYKVLAQTYHPKESSHPNAQKNFEIIGEAYAVLSDPKRRAEYDVYCAGRDRCPRPDISRYTTVVQKIAINSVIFLIIAFAVFHGVAIMKASPNDNNATGTLAPALATDTLPSQKDMWAQQIKEAMVRTRRMRILR